MFTLCRYEISKLMKNKVIVGGIVLAVVAICYIIYISFFATSISGYYDQYELKGKSAIQHNIGIANRYKGELTDEKLDAIVTDFIRLHKEKGESIQYYYDMYRFLFEVTLGATPASFLDDIELVNSEEEVSRLVHSQVKTMKELGFKSSLKPIIIGNYFTWTDFFRASRDVFIILSLIVILIGSTIFSEEKATGLLPLLFSTRFGRNKMIRAKLVSGIAITSMLFFLLQLIIFAVFFFYIGLDGWDTSVQANFDLMWVPFNFTTGWNQAQLYLFYFVFQFVALISLTCFTMFISSLCQNSFSSLALSLALFYFPKVILGRLSGTALGKMLYLFPINTYELNSTVSKMSDTSTFFFDTFVKNMGFIMGVWIVVALLTIRGSYRRMTKLSVS